MKFPVLIALPHSSNFLPKLVSESMLISKEQQAIYFDAGSKELFDIHGFHVVDAPYSRLYCDLNRAPDHKAGLTMKDRTGVIINKAYWGEDVYTLPLTDTQYQKRMSEHQKFFDTCKYFMKKEGIKFFIAGHTMNSFPIIKGERNKEKRSDIVLSNNHFVTCSKKDTDTLRSLFESESYTVSVNTPFRGGYLLNYLCHRDFLPGIQIEVRLGLFGDEETKVLDEKKLKIHKEKIKRILYTFAENITKA